MEQASHGSLYNGATFSRAMRLVLHGLNWEEVIVYLDDIIVLGTDFDGTLSALRKVLYFVSII